MKMTASAEKRPNLTQPRTPTPEAPNKRDRVELRVSVTERTREDMRKLSIKRFGQDDPQALIRFALQEIINQLYIKYEQPAEANQNV